MSTIRFGVVGCGRMGATADDRARRWAVAPWWLPLSHASAIAATEDAELAAVCDIDEAAARDAMRRFQAPKCYVDYRQMLAQEGLHAVAIATRTRERKAIIEASVQHQVRGLYCEKPLCNTLEEADELAKLLERHRVFFIYGTRRRFMPAYRQVLEQVRAGAIGELRAIVVRFGYSPLLWGGPHSVDIASFFAGDVAVEYVQADLDVDPACISESDVDADPMVRMAHIRFVNGVSAHIVASDSYDVELSGTEGMVCIRGNGAAVHWRTALPVREADEGCFLSERAVAMSREPRDGSGTINSIHALVRAMQTGAAPGYDIGLAVRNQEILFGFLYSHLEGGRKVRFPVERRRIRITGRMGSRWA